MEGIIALPKGIIQKNLNTFSYRQTETSFKA